MVICAEMEGLLVFKRPSNISDSDMGPVVYEDWIAYPADKS